ncbi:MAG: hypothetical protein ACYTGB_14840 [Planctomycetota bacterium]|jgi:hypothetical protein
MRHLRAPALPIPHGLAAALAGLCLLGLLTGACADRRSRQSDWPEGALLVARTEALAQLLSRLEQLEGTPLATRARALHRALPPCDTVESQAASGELAQLASRLACRAPQSALERLDRERGDRDLAFALPLAGGGRVLGLLSLGEGGSVELELQLPDAALGGARALLAPGSASPGASVLSGSETLIHARLRPEGGLDVAQLVPDRGQAARLFHLKSELFAGLVLDGTWEGTVYLPEPARPMPRAALALGFSHRDAAVSAMESFVRKLQATWPVHRSFFSIGEASGACLLDLNILPDFAPCYVATNRSLVVGWNPASLRKALDGEGAGSLGQAGGLVVDFERFADADALLARHALPEGAALPRSYPWRRLVAEGKRGDDGLRLSVSLRAGPDT